MLEDIDAIPHSDDHPEAHHVLDVQCNPSAMSDLEENTAHTTQMSEQESTLVAKSGVELAEKTPPGEPGRAWGLYQRNSTYMYYLAPEESNPSTGSLWRTGN